MDDFIFHRLEPELEPDPELEWEGRYPTFQQRFGGVMIDIFIFGMAAIGIAYLLKNLPEHLSYMRFIGFVLVTFIYEPLMYSLVGGTVGHLAMKTRVKTAWDETKNLSFLQGLFRYSMKIICGGFSIYKWMDPRRNLTLHDFIAKSIVVNAPGKNDKSKNS